MSTREGMSGHFPSGCSGCLADDECQDKCRRTQGVMANGVRMTSVKANIVGTQGVTATDIRTTSARAYVFQIQSVKVYVY
jgi:hypothetical protein